MLRKFLAVVLALMICVGGLMAAEATVVKADKDSVTVKGADNKEETIKLMGVKLVGADGKEAKWEALKKDAKVDVTKKDGKVTEIKIKGAGK